MKHNAELKKYISAVLAMALSLNLVFGLTVTAPAEEIEAQEDAILQMEPVLGTGTDTEAPVVVENSFWVSDKSPNLYDTVEFGFMVTDTSKLADLRCYIGTANYGAGDQIVLTYDPSKSTYTGRIKVNYIGDWIIYDIDVSDIWGNRAFYCNSALVDGESDLGEHIPIDMSGADFSVSGGLEDTEAPVINPASFSVSTTAPNRNDTVTFSVAVTDASTIQNVTCYYVGTINSGYTRMKYDNNTKKYVGTIKADMYGDYEVLYISAQDICGNETGIYNSKAKDLSSNNAEGWPTADLSAGNFTVLSIETDTDAPVLAKESLTAKKKTVAQYEANQISFRIEDKSDIVFIQVDLEVDCLHYASFSPSVNYDNNTGICTLAYYPEYFGTWQISSIWLVDCYGNNSFYKNTKRYVEQGYHYDFEKDDFDMTAASFICKDTSIHSAAELEIALAEAQEGDYLRIATDEDFVLTESITIPEGIYVTVQSGDGMFKIAKGAALTTNGGFQCNVPMLVNGSYVNNDRGYLYNNVTVGEGGCIGNNGYAIVSGKLTVNGQFNNVNNLSIDNGLTIAKIGLLVNDGIISLYGDLAVEGTLAENSGSRFARYYAVSDVSAFESPHNYANNCEDFWVYMVPGAEELKVTFDSRTNIEEDFDFLYICDGNGQQIGKYTGSALAGETVTVPGDTVKLKLVSDGSGTEWGFKVTEVTRVMSGMIGDLNGDGTCSVTDMQALYDYLSKGLLPNVGVTYCDINGDSDVNILDYQALYELIRNPA